MLFWFQFHWKSVEKVTCISVPYKRSNPLITNQYLSCTLENCLLHLFYSAMYNTLENIYCTLFALNFKVDYLHEANFSILSVKLMCTLSMLDYKNIFNLFNFLENPLCRGGAHVKFNILSAASVWFSMHTYSGLNKGNFILKLGKEYRERAHM